MRHVLIDCDPGHDDALAIMTALAHPEEMSILGDYYGRRQSDASKGYKKCRKSSGISSR